MIKIAKRYCEKYHIDWKFIKFLFIGALNTAFGYFTFALLIFIGIHYTIATLISNILSICFNFKTTGSIVFKNNTNKLITKFILVYLFNWILTTSELYICNIIGYHNMYLAGFIFIFPNALISFILMKYFVFKKVV